MLRNEKEAGVQYGEWCRQFLRARKAGTRHGDVVDALLDMHIDGKPASFELIYQVFNNITIGGLETTSWALARAIHFLAINPDIRRRLVARPEDIPAAVEESLRLLSPVWYLGRTATADTTIGNRAVSRGDFVILCYAGANRDPKVFDDPGRWDMDRPVQRHIAFGAGRHRCLGSHLARLEMVIVLEELLRRIPEFEIAPGCDVTVTTTNTVRRPSEIRIVFPVRHRQADSDAGE
jgi:cytochrome P450